MLLFNMKGLRLEFSTGRRSKSRKSARLARSGWVNRSNPVACGIAEKVGQGATQQPSIDMALSDLTHEDMLIYQRFLADPTAAD